MAQDGISRRTLFRSAGAVSAVAAVGVAGVARASDTGSTTEPLRLVRVWASKSTTHLLAGFDETHTRYADGSRQYLLWPGDLVKLQQTGLRHEIEVADLIARDLLLQKAATAQTSGLPVQPGQTSNGDYREYADFESDMRALVKKHPTKARLITLPHKTLQKRTVYGIEIATNVSHNDGRPVFYNDGCHHAREWPAAEMPMMWAYDLLESYGKDARMTALVDHTRNVIVPVVNADGYSYSRTFPISTTNSVTGDGVEEDVAGGQGAYVRKNRRPLLSSDIGDGLLIDIPKPAELDDAIGVDPNRNYPYSWGDDEGGSSSSMLDQTYRGTDPGSEQEVKNVISILHGHHVLALVTHHTDGDLVLWPWGDTHALSPDNSFLEGVGRAMATYNGYEPEQSIGLYATTGCTDDYLYGTTGGFGYTFEHAGESFHPPYLTTVPAMYQKNREALIMLASLACLAPEQRPKQRFTAAAQAQLTKKKLTGELTHAIISGRVVDSSGKPVVGTLTISKTFDTLLWMAGNGTDPLTQRALVERLETSMKTGSDGTFAWHVNPSTRPIVQAAGKHESYLLTIGDANGNGVSKTVVVKRGERLHLGDVTVG